jgi:hypothetical protein
MQGIMIAGYGEGIYTTRAHSTWYHEAYRTKAIDLANNTF